MDAAMYDETTMDSKLFRGRWNFNIKDPTVVNRRLDRFAINLHLDAAFCNQSSFYLITEEHLHTDKGTTANSPLIKHVLIDIFPGQSNQVEAAFSKDGDVYFIHSQNLITRFYDNDGKWMEDWTKPTHQFWSGLP